MGQAEFVPTLPLQFLIIRGATGRRIRHFGRPPATGNETFAIEKPARIYFKTALPGNVEKQWQQKKSKKH